MSAKPVVLLPHSITSNHYVRELGRAYVRNGMQIVYGAENLSEACVTADFVHLQWPEEHYRWFGGDAQARARQLIHRINAHKQSGAKIIWTVHNLTPHEYSADEFDQQVYQDVIDRCDTVIHHCSASRDLLATHYRANPNARHLVLPHGHFQAYGAAPGKFEARASLGMPAEAFIYLHFGQIRAYKGLTTLLSAFPLVKNKRKHLVVAGRYSGRSMQASLAEWFKITWFEKFARNVQMSLSEIPEAQVPAYMAAADVVVLSHKAGLNSGVAVLAMTYGKPVVGPDLGCISELLSQGQNLVYPVGDAKALARAMDEAASLDLGQVATANEAAANTWDWDTNVREILQATDKSLR